jgi:hypothetical protein
MTTFETKADYPFVHKSVTEELVIRNIERGHTTLDNPGICLTCGNEQDGCEPDARQYECEACGQHAVYGAEEVLLCGYYHGSKKRS